MDLNPRRVALLVAANTALAPFAIDAYLPAMGIIAESTGASIHRTELSISVCSCDDPCHVESRKKKYPMHRPIPSA